MKVFYLVIVIFILFSSCSKNEDASTNDYSTLKFKVEGKVIDYAAKNDGYVDTTMSVHKDLWRVNYVISARKSTNFINIFIIADSLVANRYSYIQTNINSPGRVIIRDNGFTYTDIASGDSSTITISRHSNGTIDGRFSGKLTKINSAGYAMNNVELVEGEFKNLRVFY